MTEILIIFLGVSLYFYVLFGGADFGAGIIELLTGRKGVRTISKAIAPIWEANHIWIILVVVILFNGFPKVYTSVSTYLHIPLLLALIGIIIRGTSFTFRYYDIPEKRTNEFYTSFFRVSSIITPFFLGIILGAIMSGIPSTPEGSFYQVFVKPWLNIFTLSTGLFVMMLFAWLASVFLIGEKDETENSRTEYSRTSILFFVFLIISGLIVFIASEIHHLHIFRQFLKSKISLGCLIAATFIVPFMLKDLKSKNILRSRILAGAVTFCVMLGWFGIQLPVMVYVKGNDNLTIWNSIAPFATIKYLVFALFFGVLIIFPAIAYLYRVFKFSKR